VQDDNYYPFGLTFNSYQRPSAKQNDFLFNGKELQDELDLGWMDYGARMYDGALGRFFTVDRLAMIFQSFTPYQYSLNNPIRFEDWEGQGPGDRVKKAKAFAQSGIPYSMSTGVNSTYKQRTGRVWTAAGMAHLDCSEFVYRVLESDGLVDNLGGNTSSLKTEFQKSEKWIKTDSPEIGDVFLWRSDAEGVGHTGIVTGVVKDEEGNITGVEISHAKGTSDGMVTEVEPLSYFTEHWGWEGFNRPVTEFRPDKIERVEGETTQQWVARAANNLKRAAANAELKTKKAAARKKERERRKKAREDRQNGNG